MKKLLLILMLFVTCVVHGQEVNGDLIKAVDTLSTGNYLKVGGKAVVDSSLTVNDSLKVSKSAVLNKNLTVGKNTDIGGNTTIGGTLITSGKTTLKNTLDVTGATDVGGNFSVTGKTQLTGDVNASNSVFVGKTIGSPNFSGFAGSGWRIDGDSSRLTLDYLTVRKSANFYELVVQKIRSINGGLVISAGNAKIDSVSVSGTTYKIYPVDTTISFVKNDIVRCQVFSGKQVKYYSALVDAVGSGYFTMHVIDGDGTPAPGDEIGQFGNTTNTARQGLIYITAVDDDSPYIDVLGGVKSANLAGCTKVRVGDLSGITSEKFGVLSGYGIYGQNCYLENGNFSGKINVTAGNAATTADVENAKSSAISTAATDATNKANNALSSAKTYATNLTNALDAEKQDAVVNGKTLIEGGYINTDFLEAGSIAADKINTSTLVVSSSNVDGLNDEISSVVDLIEVGGTNLLLNSNFKNTAHWGVSHGGERAWINRTDDMPFASKGAIQAVATEKYVYVYQRVNLDLSTEYTATFYYYVPSQIEGQAKINIFLNPSWRTVGSKIITERGHWAKASLTFTSSNDITQHIIACGLTATAGDTVKVCLAKLEEGNKATAWSPAPEDLESYADNKANEAQYSAISTASTDATTKANAALASAQSYAANLTNTLDAEKQDAIINGKTLIEGGYLNTDFLEAGTITGNKIAGNTITGNKIAAGTITADRLVGTDITALGAVTAGSFNLGSGNFKVTSDGALTAKNATITGNITADTLYSNNVDVDGGTIGGYKISGSGIVNDDGSAYVICKNTSAGKDARIGTSVFPYSCGVSGVALFSNTDSSVSDIYGLYAKAVNSGAGDGIAGKFVGDIEVTGRMNGIMSIPSEHQTSPGDSETNYLSSGYYLFVLDQKTTTRSYYLPYASSYKVGECIRVVCWNDSDARIYPRGSNTINGYTGSQKHITFKSSSDCCTLRSNGLSGSKGQWMIVSAGGRSFEF
mgnify:FL=1